MCKILKLLLVTALLGNCIASFAQDSVSKLYVSPYGDDDNSGSEESPLKTLQGARDYIRNFKKDHRISSPIDVIIKEGTYSLYEPLILSSEDAGTMSAPITFKSEQDKKVIISGGESIKNFKPTDEPGVVVAHLSEVPRYGFSFDQMYINGERMPLASVADSGFFKIVGVKELVWKKGDGRSPEIAEQHISVNDTTMYWLNQIKPSELKYVRFRAYHKWDFTVKPIDLINKDSMLFVTKGSGMKPWNPLTKGTRIVIENFKAAMDQPGEWYLDRSKGDLYYRLREGENANNLEVTIPILNKLVSIEGEDGYHMANNICLEGLSFQYCNFGFGRRGMNPNQAAVDANAAIEIKYANGIEIRDCEVRHTGQHAIWFRHGSTNGLVEHCYLNDLGGGGIYIGDHKDMKSDANIVHHITINNNIIQSGGYMLPPAIGVWIGHSRDNKILHNDISNFKYSGVSVGWVWGYTKSYAVRNTIEYNKIHHIGWDLLSDMAGVYTLGKSDGTRIANNIIHHIHAYTYGGWGLYTDEGSSNIVMENNLVYKTKTGAFHQHYGENNIIKNNIFGYGIQCQAQATRVEDHHSFDFTNNIFVYDSVTCLMGPWDKMKITMENNIYWRTNGRQVVLKAKSLTDWKRATGLDKGSIEADPMFVDPRNDNYHFKSSANTRRIKFVPFSLSEIGVEGAHAWKIKALLPQKIQKEFDQAVLNNISPQKE